MKPPKLLIIFQLVFQSLFRYWQMTNVVRIRQTKFSSSGKKNIPDSLNDGCLLSLSHIHRFQQATITFPKIQNVSKYSVNEIIQFGRRNYLGII